MRVAPRVWPFVATAAALAVVFVAAYVFFVHGYMGQLLDEQARDGAGLGRFTEPAERVLEAVPLTSAALAVLAMLIGLVRRRGLATVVALAVVAAANFTTQVLKHQLLTRPDNGATGTWHNSFPSGHTTVIASAIFALFLVSAPRVRPFVAAIGALTVAAVGSLLVGTQWHRPSDIVGGILVVAIYVLLGGAVLARRAPREVRGGGGAAGASVLIVVFTLLVSGAAFAAFALAYVSLDTAPDSTAAATVAGFVAILVAAVSTALLTSLQFRRVG